MRVLHAGRRTLQMPAGMTLAFLLIQLAAVVRVLTALNLLPWHPGILAAGVAWTLAWLLYAWRYTPILCSPRVDGKPG